MGIVRNNYLPKIISWVDNKQRGAYMFDNFLRKETLSFQLKTNDCGWRLKLYIKKSKLQFHYY